MVFNFYHELMISGRSCADAHLPGGMDWMTICCQAALLTRFTKNSAPCAHSPRTHAALKKWCNVAKGPIELHFLHESLGTSGSCISWSFYMLWEDARQQNWLPGSANIKRFYCALHALRGCQVTKLTPWKYLHSTFLVCFTRFARMLDECWATNLILWECTHLPFLLCFTHFEKMVGNKLDSLGVPRFNVSLMFCTLWEDAGQQSWFLGVATFNNPIAPYTLCEGAR